MQTLATREGVYAESAGAVSVAAVAKLSHGGVIQSGESVVCLITGHGLKDSLIATTTADLPVVNANLEEVVQAIGAIDPVGDQE